MNLRGNRAWASRQVPEALLRQWLADPDAPLRATGSRVLKHSRSSTVSECLAPLTRGPVPVIYKRFSVTRWHDPLVHLVRNTPALRSWRNGHRLLDVGIPTARPLALVHRRRFGMTWETYLVTEKLSGAVDLRTYAQSLTGPNESADRRALFEQTARLLRSLHRHHMSHRDLKAANLLVTPPMQSGETGKVHLIDLVGVQRFRKLSQRQRVQNLTRLHVSFLDAPWLTRTDKRRFLRTYLHGDRSAQAEWKTWWRGVANATQGKVAQNRRRGRPLS
jgi:serine/threonine protein kinase